MTTEEIYQRVCEISELLSSRGLTDWEQDELCEELDQMIAILETQIEKNIQDEHDE
jgi:Cdc6-like AAA superfamily ATPase